MNWQKFKDPKCEFYEKNGTFYGKINGVVYRLENNRFVVDSSLTKNPRRSAGRMSSLSD